MGGRRLLLGTPGCASVGGVAFVMGAVGVFMAPAATGLVAGATTTMTWVVVSGAVFLLGPASPIILATLLLTGLPAIWVWQRFSAAAPDAPAAPSLTPLAPQPLRGMLDQMSTFELCAAWRRSYWALLDESGGKCCCAIVHLRQTMLDELERRNADGFGRWLKAGARAGSARAATSRPTRDPVREYRHQLRDNTVAIAVASHHRITRCAAERKPW